MKIIFLTLFLVLANCTVPISKPESEILKIQKQRAANIWTSNYDELNDTYLYYKNSAFIENFKIYPFIANQKGTVSYGISVAFESDESIYINELRIFNKDQREFFHFLFSTKISRTIDFADVPNIYKESFTFLVNEENLIILKKVFESDIVGVDFIGEYGTSQYRFPNNLVDLFDDSFRAYEKIKAGEDP